MPKTNKRLTKMKAPLATLAVLGGVALVQYLTFIPQYGFAESVETGTTGQPASPNVAITVQRTLQIEVNEPSVDIKTDNGTIETGNFTAEVTSNTGYTLSVTAADGKPTALTSTTTSETIPTTSTVKPRENGWGIKVVCGDTDTECQGFNQTTDYKAIVDYGQENVFYSADTGATKRATLFEVGIGVSPSLPSGTYETAVVVTATEK